jgi:L-fucose isomerase-like protein
MRKPLVAFFPIARTTFDIELANEVAIQARRHISELPIDLVGPTGLITDLKSAQTAVVALAETPPDLLLIFQATFADSSMIMKIVSDVITPIMLWAVPEEHTGGRLRLNSFCGINLAGHAMTRAGYHYEYLYAPPDAPTALNKTLSLAKVGLASNLLRQSRIGRLGENPDGFETCLFNPDQIHQTFGLEIRQFDLAEDIFERVRQVEANRVDAILAKLGKEVDSLSDLDPTATRGTLSTYAALKDLSDQKGLDGFAVRCWPEFFTEMGCAACGAMSMLSNELLPCSCEADVNGTITQLILQSISGEPAFGTDMVSLDEERDAVVIWHCGLAPLSMADPEKQRGVTVHSNRKLPLLFDFTLKPGPVTVARLSEAYGEFKLVVGHGEIIRSSKSFSGTSGLLRFSNPARQILNTILAEGLEHHISITYGDHIDILIALAKFLDIPILVLNN